MIDNEMRCYIFEGLGGLGNCMDEFYKENERESPNNKKFKMLYNPDIKFKDRIYQDFNCAIKKIKLRDTVTSIIGEPDIYLRAKVPENMYETLQKFAEIRKLDRISFVRDFNLFPSSENLLILERKYGDSLSYFDLNGVKQKKKRRVKQDKDGAATYADDKTVETKTIYSTSDGRTTQTKSAAQIKTTAPVEESSDDEDTERAIPHVRRKAVTDCKNQTFVQTIHQRALSNSHDFTKVNI